MWKKKNTLKNRERIYLSELEKFVLLSVKDHGKEQPRTVSKSDFFKALSMLQDKGLIAFRKNYDEVTRAGLTDSGESYIEHNPDLKNPIDWTSVFVVIAAIGSVVTAIVSIISLRISCGGLR